VAPGGDDTISRAFEQLAGLLLCERASVSAMQCFLIDEHLLDLEAGAAALGAGSPLIPVVYAVDRARVSVAVARFDEARAHRRTTSRATGHISSALLHTTTTRFIACIKATPLRDLAGLGAPEVVADGRRAEAHARGATILRRSDDGAGAGLDAGTAGFGAFGP
jgi:hypothetical protein